MNFATGGGLLKQAWIDEGDQCESKGHAKESATDVSKQAHDVNFGFFLCESKVFVKLSFGGLLLV